MKIDRSEVFRLLAKCRINLLGKNEILNMLCDYDVQDSLNIEEVIEETLAYKYSGVTNEYLEELWFVLTGKKACVTGRPTPLFPCPCCKYKTLTEIYSTKEGTGYDICAVCNWEDDGTVDPDIRSSVNQGSMKEYKLNIKENPQLVSRIYSEVV